MDLPADPKERTIIVEGVTFVAEGIAKDYEYSGHKWNIVYGTMSKGDWSEKFWTATGFNRKSLLSILIQIGLVDPNPLAAYIK